MVKFTWGSGKKIRERATAFVYIPMDLDTKESGKMTKERARDYLGSQME
jgi:hypothetical protein